MFNMESLVLDAPRIELMPANGVLTFNKEKGSGLYRINDGFARLRLSVRGQERSISILGPGQLLISLPPLAARSPVVTALTDLVLEFHPVRGGIDVLRKLETSLHETAERIWGLQSRSVRAKVAATLLSLPKEWREGGIEHLDRKTLAELSGTSPETLARIITDLELDKIVERRGRDLFILDSPRLESAATDD